MEFKFKEAIELFLSFIFLSQKNKKILLKAFKVEQLGTWVKKPMEQDEFTLEESSDG